MPWTYAEEMQKIANDFLAEHGDRPASAREIGAWARDQGRWQPQPSRLLDIFAAELADAMRQEHYIDPQGRSVRAKYAARIAKEGKQQMLWADGRTATEGHMKVAFQLRRQQIAGECRQLKADVDSYNQNRDPKQPVQLTLDFTLDVAEMESLKTAS